ncbi:GNAT family N-acetyltransferase [Arthrobacter sp. B3I4]|uniref:GNAT family N-acetyltransferase n=1 Tax=Arthrobacter sp. B3I4 TaxID=3042267 RepID=UPI00278741A8|nr:GNAT family N-acetyltransferase [Arthrobacter sp. B3I4]MDQ0756960.1 GNAT superfamily N-acetyltransferase [Arthrobacter sp. B3I4]
MPDFTISTGAHVSDAEVLALYSSVGWTAYTRDPQLLMRAIRNSSFLVAARDTGGGLIGFARTVSDDATICYLQDILVEPAYQGAGIGRRLLEAIQARYGHVRQTVLLTDNEPGQRAFYEALGFTEGADFSPDPLRAFVLIR